MYMITWYDSSDTEQKRNKSQASMKTNYPPWLGHQVSLAKIYHDNSLEQWRKKVRSMHDKKVRSPKTVLTWSTSARRTIVSGRFAFSLKSWIQQSIPKYQALFRPRKVSAWPSKCYARPVKRILISNRKKGGTIKWLLRPNDLPPCNIAIYQISRYIIMKCLPANHIENQEFRRISKHGVIFSRKTLISIMFNLVELVEKRTRLEICNTTGT